MGFIYLATLLFLWKTIIMQNVFIFYMLYYLLLLLMWFQVVQEAKSACVDAIVITSYI